MTKTGTAFLDSLRTKFKTNKEKATPEHTPCAPPTKSGKQSDQLIEIGQSHDLFHDRSLNPYARVGNAVFAIDSRVYQELLAERYFKITASGCSRNAISDAINTLASIAKFDGSCRDVSLRVAGTRNLVCIDMGTKDHAFLEISASGWKWGTTDRPMFRRTPSTLALPTPAAADFSRIWRYLNVKPEHRPLVAGFMLASLCPLGPYPALHLSGEQGTGKSTNTRIIKRLLDPSTSMLRPAPKDTRDLLVGGLNGWVLALDNLSFLSPQMSDAFCRLSTGGAIAERSLYSNVDEVLIELQRPIILNGIEDLACRSDLAERGLLVELEPVSNRLTESDLWGNFLIDEPYIFGALVEGVVHAIRNHETISIGAVPRMADFAKWAAAGVLALGFTANEFMDSYRLNIATSQFTNVHNSAVGEAVHQLMKMRSTWSGTATDLLRDLAKYTNESIRRNVGWPTNPKAMASALKRLAPALRATGISVSQKRSDTARLILLDNSVKTASFASLGHESSKSRPDSSNSEHREPKSYPTDKQYIPIDQTYRTNTLAVSSGAPLDKSTTKETDHLRHDANDANDANDAKINPFLHKIVGEKF